MNVRSLRFRLAAWYFCTVAAICSSAAGGYWLAIRTSLNHALDQGLRYRLMGLRHFLEDIDPDGKQISSRLNAISQLGELFQVFDANGVLIAQSSGLERHGVPRRPPRELGFEIEAIRTLLALQDNPDQSCVTADHIARARLVEVEQRIRSLTALKSELDLMINGCRHGHVATCHVIEVLADHGKCAHDKH